jgi:hypothetical protein
MTIIGAPCSMHFQPKLSIWIVASLPFVFLCMHAKFSNGHQEPLAQEEHNQRAYQSYGHEQQQQQMAEMKYSSSCRSRCGYRLKDDLFRDVIDTCSCDLDCMRRKHCCSDYLNQCFDNQGKSLDGILPLNAELVHLKKIAVDTRTSTKKTSHVIDTCLPGDDPTGKHYRGNVAVTMSKRDCQPWILQFPHAHHFFPSLFPGLDMQSNFCRNPDNSSLPWCFTMDPNVPWEVDMNS